MVAGLAITYFPWRLLRYGRKGFPAHLNVVAAHKTAQVIGMEDYDLRRELLYYQLASGKSPLVSGHYPFSSKAYEDFHDQYSFITVLRDPIDRWFSEYMWNRYKKHDYKKTDLDLEEYFESQEGQCNTTLLLNFFGEKKVDAPSAQKDIQRAVDALGKFEVIGDLGDIKTFYSQMKACFGKKPLLLKRNKSPALEKDKIKFDPNSSLHKKIAQALEADMEVYRQIKEKISYKCF